MFGHENSIEDISEFLLSQFSLEEILEMNDLTEEEALCILITKGLINEPERILQPEEGSGENTEEA